MIVSRLTLSKALPYFAKCLEQAEKRRPRTRVSRARRPVSSPLDVESVPKCVLQEHVLLKQTLHAKQDKIVRLQNELRHVRQQLSRAQRQLRLRACQASSEQNQRARVQSLEQRLQEYKSKVVEILEQFSALQQRKAELQRELEERDKVIRAQEERLEIWTRTADGLRTVAGAEDSQVEMAGRREKLAIQTYKLIKSQIFDASPPKRHPLARNDVQSHFLRLRLQLTKSRVSHALFLQMVEGMGSGDGVCCPSLREAVQSMAVFSPYLGKEAVRALARFLVECENGEAVCEDDGVGNSWQVMKSILRTQVGKYQLYEDEKDWREQALRLLRESARLDWFGERVKGEELQQRLRDWGLRASRSLVGYLQFRNYRAEEDWEWVVLSRLERRLVEETEG